MAKLTEEDLERIRLRARNLDKLIGQPNKRGRYVEFADKYGLNSGYLSLLVNGHKNMGDKAARKLEAAIGLPEYAFDNPAGADASLNSLTDQLRPDQIELLERFAKSSPEIQEAILKVLAPLAQKKEEEQ